MKHAIALSATLLAAAVAAGCAHDSDSMQGDSSPAHRSGPAVVGTPGATTGPSSGYDASDPSHYHPQTDDTSKYHPADPNAVRSQSGQ